MTRTTGLAAATAVLLLAAGTARAGGPEEMDRPAYAKPGQCFEKVRTAEVFETVPERQMVAPERIEHRLVPAEFEWRDRSVVTRPARTERYSVPPTFRTVFETVVVRPASVRLEVIPPVYEPVARQVLVREARTVWKPGYAQPRYGQSYYAPPGYGPGWRGQTQVTPTGEIMCLVVEPALYRTVIEQVMRVPERTVEIPVPAETRQEARQVVDRPGYEAAREIPAEYGMVREKVVVRPEHDESYTTPPVFRTVESRRLVSPSRTEWREIACAAPPPPPCRDRCAPPPMMRMSPPPPMRHPRPMERPRVHHRYWSARSHDCGVCVAPSEGRAPPPSMDRGPERRPAVVGQGRMVSRVQAALAGRGYYRGPVDGVFTEPTREALVRFQTDRRFAAQGELTRETARELGLAR